MGKKAPSAPAAPDPAATAQAQAAANKETAIANAQINQVNQYTPYGSLEYTERGKSSDGTPQYSATQTLSPEQKQLYDLQTAASQKYGETANAQMGAIQGKLSQPLDYSSLGAAPVANENTRQAVAQSMYDRLNPELDRQRAQLETRLANQGISLDSDTYRRAMDEINRSQNDARLAIDARSGDEMARLYGLESNARDRAVNEMVQQRQIPLNELSAMLSGSQVQGPNFISPPQVQMPAPDIAGMTYANYNGAMNAYNGGVGAASANTQGLYGLLGSGMRAGAYAWGK